MANVGRSKKIQMIKQEVEAKTTEAIEAAFEVVELIGDIIDSVGDHTVYLKQGYVRFKDGVAEVRAEVAAELRKLGLVK